MAVAISAIAERLEHSGATPSLARAIATELRDAVRSEAVTREHLDLALGKLRAEVEREIAGRHASKRHSTGDPECEAAKRRIDMERLFREQANKVIGWAAAFTGLAVAIAGGLHILF